MGKRLDDFLEKSKKIEIRYELAQKAKQKR